jgi:thiol-disulfide isomerase/thioredoxin
MKIFRKILIVLLILAASLLIYSQIYQKFYPTQNATAMNFSDIDFIENMKSVPAPDFSTIDLQEATVQLSQIKEPIIIINFWASWCTPCLEEIPSLHKLVATFAGKIHLIAVSGDSSIEEMRIFLKSYPELTNKNISIVWDKDKELMKLYRVNRLPESFILSSDKKLVKKVVGSIDWYTFESKEFIKNLLATKQ